MVDGVVALADNAVDSPSAMLNLLTMSFKGLCLHMQMRLPVLPRILDPLLQDLLRLLDILPMQIDRVRRDSSVGVVLAEDKLGRLPVILLHLPAMLLAFLGELLSQSAVAVLVGLS